MLTHLSIKNYVLIESLQMNLNNGLNTITGETGAGKSIMLGAVGLLLGKRADTKTLLNSEEKCVVEGSFDITSYHLEDRFEEWDIDYSPQTIIRREITPSGKSRAFINDTPVLLDVLKNLGNYLLDIHSQHDTLLLGEGSFQLDMLDAYARNTQQKEDYKKAFLNYKSLERKFNKLRQSADDLKKEYDYNKFLLDELEAANLRDVILEELEEEQNKLDHTEEIKTALNQTLEVLDGNEISSLEGITQASQLLQKISDYGEKYTQLTERIQSALIELQDVKREIENEESLTEYDPVRAEEVNETLSNIYRLCKKHHVNTVEELLKIEEELAEKVSSVDNFDLELEKLEEAKREAEKILKTAGEILSKSRKAVSELICNEAVQLLVQLSIPEAKLQVDIQPANPEENGCDEIRFLFSANAGVPVQELGKVASGGEFSRLMFTFKYLMAGKHSHPTLIFDEIDTGISGEVALQLGKMMKLMGKDYQVITITHLPQIAALGQKHWFVYKTPGTNTTVSKIRELDGENRILEIAKMIAGESPSSSALESAKELIG